jgi:hypothetical protein
VLRCCRLLKESNRKGFFVEFVYIKVDVPITNITAVKRMQAAELEALILEDVGLRLQEEQRFLDVVFRTDRGNIVVAPRAMQKRKNDGGRKKVVDPEDFVQSLHFMMSAESLAVARTKLVQYLDETPSSASDGVPLLVTNCAEIAGIPSKRDLIELMPHIPPMFQVGLKKKIFFFFFFFCFFFYGVGNWYF